MYTEGLTAVLLVCAVLTIADSVTFVLERDTVAVSALKLVLAAFYGEGPAVQSLVSDQLPRKGHATGCGRR